MKLSDFKIRHFVFEVRYEDSYALWDCAGKLHKELATIWPGAELVEVKPNQQVLQNDQASIHTTINSARVMVKKPGTILQSVDKLTETLRTWVSRLEIEQFTRVGTRVVYVRNYSSLEEANRAAVELGLVRYPEDPVFNHKSSPASVEARLLWKDSNFQTQVLIKSENQRIEISGLPDHDKEVRSSDWLILDIDRATNGLVEVAKFRLGDWLEGVRHLISRDIEKILNTK